MNKSFLFFAIMLAGAITTPSGAWAAVPQKDSEPAAVKVISYNIRCVNDDDKGENAWDARKEGSVNMILAEKPDVIGFQEPWPVQIQYLTENLPQYGCYEFGRETGLREDGGEHLMVMWNKEKYDLVESGHFWLSETPDVVSKGWDGQCYRITLWIHVREKASGREFWYFDTHLDHMGDIARREGAKVNVQKMKEIAGEDATVFFSGDMNVVAGTEREKDLLGAYTWLNSARSEAPETDSRPTFTAFGKSKNPQVIDYIYYRNATPLKFETLDGEGYGVKYISDHYPVAAVFSL